MNFRKQRFSLKKVLIIFMTVLTAGIHFSLNFGMGKVDPLFTLNGLGYLGLLSFYLFPPKFLFKYDQWIRILFLGFTLVTIILWVFLGKPFTTIGYIDKFLEMILVVLLVIDRPNID